MKLSNNELANILREIKPFEIDKGCDAITRKEYEYDITPNLSIYTWIIINRSGGFTYLENDGSGIAKQSIEPISMVSFEGTQIFFDGEDISDNYQKEMIEEYLRLIITT